METRDIKDQFHLMRLSPEAVQEEWEAIWQAIEEALPPIAGNGVEERKAIILQNLLSGLLECLVLYVEDKPVLVLTIAVTTELFSGTKDLLLYSLFGYEPLVQSGWFLLYRELIGYAKVKGCSRVIAYSNRDNVIQLAKFLGGDISNHFIIFNL